MKSEPRRHCANGYVETSFLPGRRFTSLADVDGQLSESCGRPATANTNADSQLFQDPPVRGQPAELSVAFH